MARYRRMEVLNAMYATGVVPVFYHPEVDVSRASPARAPAGGAPSRVHEPRRLRVGGLPRAREVLRAGGPGDDHRGRVRRGPGHGHALHQQRRELRGRPVLNPEVARTCNRRKGPLLPRLRHGLGDLGGGGARLRDRQDLPRGRGGRPVVREGGEGSLPWTSIMPREGGAHRGVPLRVVQAGVACVGIGSNLVTKRSSPRGTGTASRRRWRRRLPSSRRSRRSAS